MHEIHRRNLPQAHPGGDQVISHSGSGNSKPVKKATTLASGFTLTLLIVYNVVVIIASHWPLIELTELPDLSSLNSADFNYHTTRQHLNNITQYGPRLAGSDENERFAPEYIVRTLEKIQRNDLNQQKFTMEIDLQRISGGSFRRVPVHKLHEYISVYQDIQNVVLRVLPADRTPDAVLLVNSHYDTVPDSPGAGDDASSCAVMLELVRAIVSSKHGLMNGIVFLWNGAEEKMLQASHAFITQHRWVAGPPRIAAFVNLDAAGSSGREIAFQIGPENPWLIEAYSKTVRHAWASIAAQEIFESGIIPSGTDYQQFRDYGRLPGIDLAFVQNGYVYHTVFDTPDLITDPSLHRAGCNLLALIKEIANSSLLVDPGAQRYGKVVFYDLLGLFMVVYPKPVATVLNLLVCMVVLLISIRPKLGRTVHVVKLSRDNRGVSYPTLLLKMLIVVVFKFIFTFVAVIVVALLATRTFRHTMPWYSHTWAVLVYLLPAIILQLRVTETTRNKIFANIDVATLDELHFDAFQLFLSVILFVLTSLQIGSAYIIMIWIVNAFLVRTILFDKLLCKSINSDSAVRAVITTSASCIVAAVQHVYLSRTILQVIVPVLARSGTEVNVEVVYSAIFIGLCCLPLLSQANLLYRIHLRKATILLGLLFAALFSTLCLADCGFPFSKSSSDPAVYPRRLTASHITRVISQDDEIRENSTYLWLHTWDSMDFANLQESLSKNIDFSQVQRVACDTENLPYCGIPWLFPVAKGIRKHYLVPLPMEVYPKRPAATLKQVEIKELRDDNDVRSYRVIKVSLQLIDSPSHTNLYVATRSGVEFRSWTVRVGGASPVVYDKLQAAYVLPATEPDGEPYMRSHYVLLFTRASSNSSEPLRLDLEFTVGSDRSGKVRLAEVAHGPLYLHPPYRDTPQQDEVKRNLPDWVTVQRWGGHYESRTVSAMLR